jgi:diguanylate cyclase (GGDEF)-like protein/PAS domain S-box-containing protein
MARLLHHWLTLSLSVLVVFPVMIVTGFLLVSLVPQIQSHVEGENRALSHAIAAQVDAFLISAAGGIERLGEDIAPLPAEDPRIQQRLDTLATTDLGIDVLYLLDARNRVVQVGLDRSRRAFREDYVGLDFSARNYVQAARRSGWVTWSDTYLSTRGEVSVAVAIPHKGRTLVGEMDLRQLSEFVRQLGETGKLMAVLVDRQGRVVAHPDASKGLQQDSLAHNRLVQGALAGQVTTGEVEMEGVAYVGTASSIQGLGWVALVVQPKSVAFAAQRTVLYALIAGTLFSLLVALSAALMLARAVTRRMHEFGDLMQAVAHGDYRAGIPAFRVTELNDLADSMRRMAAAVLERESRLQRSEAEYRDVVEGTDDLITRVNLEGRLLFVNHASRRFFGLEPSACIGISAFDFVHPEDRETTQQAFAKWIAEAATTLNWENRQVSRSGAVHRMQWNVTAVRDATNQITGFTSIARDVTQQRRAEENLRLAASVFNASAEGILITDADMRILSVNPALTNITGHTAGDAIGKTPAIFKSGRHDQVFYRTMFDEIAATGSWQGEIWNRRKNGEIFPEWLTITAVKNAEGVLTHYIGSFFDVSERKDAEEHIQFMANHDALTRLPNRTLLDDRIRQAIVTSRRKESRTAILLLDLDRFKLINDTLGHDIGDRVLEAVARRLTGTLRETETVARLGGDEFIILVPDIESIERVSMLAQKILNVVAEPHRIGDHELHVTPSIGISIFPEDGADAPTLLRGADTAMYHAKGVGRNNFQFFTSSMNYVVQERMAIENDLRRALEKGEFLLYYQPQVNCRTGAVMGMEALIRWQHPQRGLVAPDKFIPIAEETGLIVPIGEWVLREACRQAKAWHDMGHAGLRMGVNLSARQFQQPDLLQQIHQALEDSGLATSALELEITEGMLMEDPDAAAELLRKLATLGIRLAIDDFGTGYSSLAYLKRFPLHRLKIDKSFVRDISSDPNDAAIVSAVVGLADALNMEVIAEGVESVDQLRYLERNGCCEIQGYFFSRPQPASHFTSFRYELPGPAAH